MATVSVCRNLPGTKWKVIHWKNFSLKDCFNFAIVPIEQMDTSFALQQYLQLRVFSKDGQDLIMSDLIPPQNQDKDVWLYEHLRFYSLKVKPL
jgi:hypothetical protein